LRLSKSRLRNQKYSAGGNGQFYVSPSAHRH
jgi:hypothetical protein